MGDQILKEAEDRCRRALAPEEAISECSKTFESECATTVGEEGDSFEEEEMVQWATVTEDAVTAAALDEGDIEAVDTHRKEFESEDATMVATEPTAEASAEEGVAVSAAALFEAFLLLPF